MHGLSMGGAAASALGVHNPGLKVTVDQTFASIHEVSANVGKVNPHPNPNPTPNPTPNPNPDPNPDPNPNPKVTR